MYISVLRFMTIRVQILHAKRYITVHNVHHNVLIWFVRVRRKQRPANDGMDGNELGVLPGLCVNPVKPQHLILPAQTPRGGHPKRGWPWNFGLTADSLLWRSRELMVNKDSRQEINMPLRGHQISIAFHWGRERNRLEFGPNIDVGQYRLQIFWTLFCGFIEGIDVVPDLISALQLKQA
ncbi:hypothetical protein B0H17DRAFT_1149687 [Mycena rosella]|uniref:Uncharacterized protein n=1 Tax=Mycena rosella TaxID=1033263 RepID=A0AAD7FSI7_MYCRO|nr:hypothetical protein B0H17DRAFT_1149687 [Mycena rosella]